MALLVLLMGLIPQIPETNNSFISKIGLTHLKHSWTMLIISIILLISLGLVILKRLTPFSKKNFGFLLNHFGLWLVVATGSLGSSDLIRLNMYVTENNDPVWYAEDANNYYELPFAIKLEDFNIKEYNPNICLIDNKTGKITNQKEIYIIEEGKNYKLDKWNIHIDKFYPLSYEVEGNFIEYLDKGACPSAKITVKDDNNNIILTDWLTTGGFYMKSKMIYLNEDFSITLLQPEPKEYSSKVEIFTKDGKREKVTIMVNKPYKIKGWKIYQISYDTEKGRWSEMSVLEIVRDPWLPFIYVGLFMVLLGAIYLFWLGKKTNTETTASKVK